MSLKTAHKLAVCCLNVSEGRNLKLIDDIAYAAVRNQDKWTNCENEDSIFKCKSTVLSVYSDPVFNRGNVTIASTIQHLGTSVFQACAVAFENIDLEKHSNPGHPRLGVVDLIPIHPISTHVSLEECSNVAHEIADLITSRFPGTGVFYFGKADQGERSLVQRRKEMNWFSDVSVGAVVTPVAKPDKGEISPQYGISAIGAIPYMSVLNVLLDTDDLKIGKYIANNIRERNNGLKGIQAMAFQKGSKIEIACNVDTNDLQSNLPTFNTSFDELEDTIRRLAMEKNISICGHTVRGFTPDEAYKSAVQALMEGNISPWKHQRIDVM